MPNISKVKAGDSEYRIEATSVANNSVSTSSIINGAVTLQKLNAEVLDAINELVNNTYPAETQSNVASVVTDIGAENIPLKSLVVNVTATQGGSGTPSVDNVRPITGRTSLNVVVSPTASAQDGTTYTVSLAAELGGVYIGRLNVTTGALTVYGRKFTLDGKTPAKKFYRKVSSYTGGNMYLCVATGTNNRTPLMGDGIWLRNFMKSNMFSYRFSGDENAFLQWEYGYAPGSENQFFAFPTGTQYSTLDSINNWLSAHPIEAVFALSEPQTVQLTPTEVLSILGQMYLSCDAGNIIEATYRLDPTLAYDKLKAAIVAAGTT